MNRKTILAILSILLLGICLYFLYLNNKGNDVKVEKITFGISPFPDTYMPYLGKLKGWYQEEGLDVDFKVLGWTEVQEALSSGASSKIDLGINNISSIIATHNKNPNLIYYYGFNTFDNGFALMGRKDGPIQPLSSFITENDPRDAAISQFAQQLKGKNVITTANTDMEQGVAAIAKSGNLDFLKDLTITNLNPDDGITAFISGSGDAFIGGIPQRNKAAEQGMIELITGTDLGPAPINGIVTTKVFQSQNDNALLKILKVWFRIVNYTNQNLDEVALLMTTELNKKTGSTVSVEDFKKFWNNYEHYPANLEEIDAEILSPSGKNYWKARWDDCNDYFFNIKGVIKEPVSSDDAFYMLKTQENLKSFLNEK